MKIQVMDDHIAHDEFSVEQLVAAAPNCLPISERVPAVEGEAFDLKAWHQAWKKKHGAEQTAEPTHCKVEATDEFQAVMPWSELDLAVFLYAQEGQPLQKGYPIRLYVPDGSSECLNVKSVVKIWFLHDAALGDEASYGFKNMISADEMMLKK
jgi:hypothetical protein